MYKRSKVAIFCHLILTLVSHVTFHFLLKTCFLKFEFRAKKKGRQKYHTNINSVRKIEEVMITVSIYRRIHAQNLSDSRIVCYFKNKPAEPPGPGGNV